MSVVKQHRPVVEGFDLNHWSNKTIATTGGCEAGRGAIRDVDAFSMFGTIASGTLLPSIQRSEGAGQIDDKRHSMGFAAGT